MANARNKTVDKTFLSLDKAEERGFIHRDYIAHCLRWSHVIKRLGERKAYQSARILDVGCGRELPLPKLLYSSKYIVEQYYGVDMGPILDTAMAAFDSGKFPVKVWERTNLLELTEEDVENVNYVTCFEVLEHVEPSMMLDMLRHLRKITNPECVFWFSTPCWNRTDCAANHVNEMTYEALGSVFEREGFKIEAVHGTFASIRDYEHLLPISSNAHLWPDKPSQQLFNKLRAYYDTNFLSCIFAPLFPAQSRNCLWELQAVGDESQRALKFPQLDDCKKPWGSSALWKQMKWENEMKG